MEIPFFQVLLYHSTIWTETNLLEKKLNRNCRRMSRAIFNESCRAIHFPSRTTFNKGEQDMLDPAVEVRTDLKGMFPLDFYIWIHHCWVTRKILYLSDLCRHLMPSRGPTMWDVREKWMERERERERERESEWGVSVLAAYLDDGVHDDDKLPKMSVSKKD